MPIGFQRILDLSSLSLKLLNDQLDLLWKKVMGGIDLRDLSKQTRGALDAKASAQQVDALDGTVRALETSVVQTAEAIALTASRGEIASMIEQRAEEVTLAVGQLGGENLLRNGAAAFGLPPWRGVGVAASTVFDGALGSSCFVLTGDGALAQDGLTLKAGRDYTLSALVYADGGSAALALCDERGAVLAQGEAHGDADANPGAGWTLLHVTAHIGEAVKAEARVCVVGGARVTALLLAEGGAPTAWRPNPGELQNSSILITDERVRIATQNFELSLKDESGQEHTGMTAGTQGFADLHIAGNLILRGRPMYRGPGSAFLYVHPDALGQGRWFAPGEALTGTEGCFGDIQSAIDFVPRWCDGDVVIRVHPMAGAAYPASHLEVRSMFGGGSLTLTSAAPGTHFTIASLRCANNALNTTVEWCAIASNSAYDYFSVLNATATLSCCRIDGRGFVSNGYLVQFNGVALMYSCEAHRCVNGASATNGGRIYMEACAGSGNGTGSAAVTGGMISQHPSASGIAGSVNNRASSGGAILVAAGSFTPAALPPQLPIQTVVTFAPGRIACYQEGGGWREGLLAQGDEGGGAYTGGLWWPPALTTALAGKTLLSARLRLTRRSAGGSPGPVAARLIGLAPADAASAPQRAADYGPLEGIARGETRTVRVPVAVVADLISGTSAALALCEPGGLYAAYEGLEGTPPEIEVAYR